MIQPGRYDYLPQERVIFGTPAAEAVAAEAERRGARRVFVIASRTLSRETDAVAALRRALGPRDAGLWDETVAHVPRASVIAAAEAVRAAAPDLLVTVGGGTPIDTAKAVQICLARDVASAEQLGEYRVRTDADGTRRMPEVGPSPVRQIIVPTTLSGAEFSNIGGVVDPERRTKDMYTGPDVCGVAVVLDPAITAHTPDWLWLSTGLRAVDHAVETICSASPQPFTDATCRHALAMFARSLRRNRAAPEDLGARLESQMAVWLACAGLGRVPYGASHGIGHQLGAVAEVPHGYCSCVMLPSVLRWNEPVNGAQQETVSEALGAPGTAAGDAVAALVADLGLPTRLRDVGVTREQFPLIAEGSLENLFVRQNPRPVTAPGDIVELLEMAW